MKNREESMAEWIRDCIEKTPREKVKAEWEEIQSRFPGEPPRRRLRYSRLLVAIAVLVGSIFLPSLVGSWVCMWLKPHDLITPDLTLVETRLIYWMAGLVTLFLLWLLVMVMREVCLAIWDWLTEEI